MDTIETAEDRQMVVDYVTQNAAKALGSYSVTNSSSSSSNSNNNNNNNMIPSYITLTSTNNNNTTTPSTTTSSSFYLPIFAVSGKQGLTAKLVNKRDTSSIHPSMGAGATLYQLSQIELIENYLKTVLGEQELIKNKLLNPLMVSSDSYMTIMLLIFNIIYDIYKDNMMMFFHMY